mmetsp:Transcript_57930/g.134963  ORF Transcript_57930/g.134963 Transcript_57930/m.134963 type:complete len:224 (+) Transcript_57930:544-1215(+)
MWVPWTLAMLVFAYALPEVEDMLVQLDNPNQAEQSEHPDHPSSPRSHSRHAASTSDRRVVRLEKEVQNPSNVHQERRCRNQVEPEEEAQKIVVLANAGGDQFKGEQEQSDDGGDVEEGVRWQRSGGQPDVVANQRVHREDEHGCLEGCFVNETGAPWLRPSDAVLHPVADLGERRIPHEFAPCGDQRLPVWVAISPLIAGQDGPHVVRHCRRGLCSTTLGQRS